MAAILVLLLLLLLLYIFYYYYYYYYYYSSYLNVIVHLGLNVSSSAHNCGCVVDGGNATAAI